MGSGSQEGQWIQNPRVWQCVNNIQLGAKMGLKPITSQEVRTIDVDIYIYIIYYDMI